MGSGGPARPGLTVGRRRIRFGAADKYFRFPERKFGAGDGIRTHDPNLGKVVLYP